ncbi:hypothetical protein DMC30DRAFT_414596 [Rhodotorula diobovata]|uniref:peptidyl-tRNA hydrolase n=1 Tax=Rhodotorula diobovata TaxID=5288 RepID=A0A5C5G352_9BASI|nr:hypothetical protein DMC30DRAFT_414596 [Rhodotorula diobovata]
MDRFPDELLLRLVEPFSAHAWTRKAYATRQATLRALCLASRRWKALAQPLLFRHVRVDDKTRLGRLRATDPALRASTTVLHVACEEPELQYMDPEDFRQLIMSVAGTRNILLPNLEELRIEGYLGPFELPCLTTFFSLRRLSFTRLGSLEAPRCWALPDLVKLVVLRIDRTFIDQDVVDAWFTANELPSLRALFFNCRSHPLPHIRRAFFAQLDVMEMDTENDDYIKSHAHQRQPPYLMAIDFPLAAFTAPDDYNPRLPRHAKLVLRHRNPSLQAWSLYLGYALPILTGLVKRAPRKGERPRRGGTLILPDVLALPHDSVLRVHVPELVQSVDALKAACDKVGVDVLFAPRDDDGDELVSSLFLTVAARRLVVVGLGNFTHPLTRHSVGQVLLKNLAKRAAASSSRLSGSATLLSSKFGRHTSWTTRILLAPPPQAADQTPLEVLFVLPKALMNVSGPTASAAFDGFLPPLALPVPSTSSTAPDEPPAAHQKRKKPPAAPLKPMLRLVTLQDDLDLAPFAVKYQRGGGPRGHNGVRSLSSALKGSRDFHRVWIGIGRPEERSEVASYVLRPLSRDEVRACEYDGDAGTSGAVLDRAWAEVLRIGFEEV